jgi:uncharacterized protein (TIGR02145 family)
MQFSTLPPMSFLSLKIFYFILLFLALAAYGQQERVAIINTVDDGDSIKPSDLTYLTDKLRETAVNVLPESRYGVMTTESIIAFLGSQERMVKECKAASCLAELGRKVSADYVAQARIGRFGANLTIKTELYSSKSGNLIGSFTGDSKDIFGLLAIINDKTQDLFKKMQGVPGSSANIYEDKEKVDRISKPQGGKFLTDERDGKTYRPVQIGKQMWMAENLNYNASGSKCYDNKPANCDKYGRLYDWETAKKACLKGWHLPSDKEWQELVNFAGGDKVAGKKLKAKSGWNSNGNGTDAYGFAALPGGYGSSDGYFGTTVGLNGYWWSATESNADNAYGRYMSYYYEYVHYDDIGKYLLFSVRCLQD